nr:immunoglobulin light chain junction region [Macaca mulatta]MOV72570.1 immunoglobulin light chain junction region [Macaca mulatta]MOV72747.1 immunoglobulin light chain junction region [Macaca mulatta]MOV72832.1 immunoglobulin light chain junction region [Macaca mulatta]MOV73445.1 immunoglobulin light chain junction region [Macaca mulatta]
DYYCYSTISSGNDRIF